MTDESIDRIKSAVESAEHLPAEKKAELLDSLSKLRPAIANLSQTHVNEAQRIAQLVEDSANEASRREQNPEQLTTILRRLEDSVEKFETSHPKIVEVVSEYSTLLSNMGL